MGEWTIFGKTPVPYVPGGDSNHDAGIFIDRLVEQKERMLIQLGQHCMFCKHVNGCDCPDGDCDTGKIISEMGYRNE